LQLRAAAPLAAYQATPHACIDAAEITASVKARFVDNKEVDASPISVANLGCL
jgi:hypothetical protein